MEGDPLPGDQAKVGEAGGQFLQSKAGLQFAEAGPQAVVQAPAEGQVLVGIAPVQVEVVGVVEPRFINDVRADPVASVT